MSLVEKCVEFIYFEKAKYFGEISTVDLTVTTQDKSTVEISQNFVSFSEYRNFTFNSKLLTAVNALELRIEFLGIKKQTNNHSAVSVFLFIYVRT